MAALYQTARPVTFEEVVGQEHVKEVLVTALKRDRIGHAYLFSGPRGVGKTTTARLLAMAVNCGGAEAGARPCGKCESCLLVRRGSHPDVIELDAASNNSVEDIRDLREKVRLSSVRGGRRVWVLDEAHMLTKAAANALLKTLEEPPEGLLFVLATTEPEKLPPTILSRTQHFRFRRHTEPEIIGKLARLCSEAGVEAQEEALALVARAADGAMRDAESLLERLLASGETITREGAEDALGLPPQDRLRALASHLAKGDLNALFAEARDLYADGFAPRSLAEQLKLTLRDAVYQKVGISSDGFAPGLEEAELLRLIHMLDDEDERFVRRNDLFSLEVALIKTLNALLGNLPEAAAPAEAATAAPRAAGASLPDFDPTGRGAAVPPRRQSASSAAAAATGPEREPSPAPKANWHSVLAKAGAQLKAFMIPAQAELDGSDLRLEFPETHKFHFEQLRQRRDELRKLVAEVMGPGVGIELVGPGESRRKKS